MGIRKLIERRTTGKGLIEVPTIDASAGVGSAGKVVSTGAAGTIDPTLLPAATTSTAGSLSAADKTKLNATSGTNTGDQATNLSIASQTSTTLNVASSTGTAATVPVATTSLGGLMSAADKTSVTANTSTLAAATATSAGAGDTGKLVKLDAGGLVGPSVLPAATTGAAGSMSSTDKTKLNAITGTNTGDQVASGVTVTATGNISSTTVQAALQEIQGDIDGLNAMPPCTFIPTLYVGGSVLQAANQTFYTRVSHGSQATCSKIRMYIATSSGNICVGVYSNSGASPSSRVATSGTVASPGTGMREITISPAVDIVPGMWISLSADNTTASFGRGGAQPGLLGNALGTGFQYYENVYPAPATASPTVAWFCAFILIGVV